MKKWQIVLIVILVCIPVIVGIFLGGAILKDVFNELGEEKKLKTEMEEITELLEKQDISEDEINKKLDVIVTDGDYGKVEKASKEYLIMLLRLKILRILILNLVMLLRLMCVV